MEKRICNNSEGEYEKIQNISLPGLLENHQETLQGSPRSDENGGILALTSKIVSQIQHNVMCEVVFRCNWSGPLVFMLTPPPMNNMLHGLGILKLIPG